jgi:hypothetical protein
MWSWQTVTLFMAFLIALGKYLDSGHFNSEAKERIKLRLISFYFWLDDIPNHLPKKFFKSYFPVATLIVVGWTRFQLSKFGFAVKSLIFVLKSFIFLIAVLSAATGIALLTLLFKSIPAFTPFIAISLKEAADGAHPVLVSGILTPFLQALSSVLIMAFVLLYVGFTIILDLVRLIMIVCVSKATEPSSSPFLYFSSLLAVIAALIALAVQAIS